MLFAIKRMRTLCGLTQAAVARSLNVQQNTVSQWESGTRTPRAAHIIELAKLFGCTADELLKEDGGTAEEGDSK